MRSNFFISLIITFVIPSFCMANPGMPSNASTPNQLQQPDKNALAPPCSMSADAATSNPAAPSSSDATAAAPSEPISTDATPPGPSGPPSEDAAAPGPSGPPSEDAAAPGPSGPPSKDAAAPGPSSPSTDITPPATSGTSATPLDNMAPAKAPTVAASQVSSDAESLCIIRQINTNEIALAKQMLKRLHRNKEPMKTAKKLAHRIIEDHNIINGSLDAVVKKTSITPATVSSSKNCADIKNAGDALMKKLSRYKGPGLARQFIDDMRQGHSDGQILVQSLADKATNPEINKFLLETKGLIHAHESISTEDQEKVNR